MKITVLLENNIRDKSKQLFSNPGLSLHIQKGDDQILFDTGNSGFFIKNAEKLGINLHDVKNVVISHGHFDHGGGLPAFLEMNKNAKIFISENAKCSFYLKLGFIKKYIGLKKSIFKDYPKNFIFVNNFQEILSDCFIITYFPEKHPAPKGNKYLFKETDGKLVKDDFSHEIALVIKSKNGMVIFSGCSHKGLLNIVDKAITIFPGVPVKAVIGGFHFMALPKVLTFSEKENDVIKIGERLLKYPIEKIYTLHCTGTKGFQIIKNVLGDKISYLKTGDSVDS